jgi:hypothetical protein
VWLFSRTGTASDPWEIYNPGGFPTWLRAADGRGEEAFGLANGDRFGESVAIDEKANTIVVGAPDETNPDDNACNTTNYQAQCEKGAAYVFELDLGTGQFVEQAKLVAPLLGDNGFDHLGTSVGVSGETIAVGTPNSHPFEDIYKLGSVLVFERVGDVWNQTASIDAPVVGLSGSGNPIEGFGFSVDLRGDVMLVGYGQEDPPPYPNPFCPLTVSGGGNCGAAYLFRRNGSTWVEDLKLIASEEAENNFVGTSVALAADAAVVGATPAQINAEVPVRRGRVYVYSFEPAPTFAVSFEDPDIPASGIDLEELTLLWGPDTGDYTLIWRASPAQPFIGNFRLNANLFNADAEASTSFFSDTFNDYSLVQPQTIIIENGSSAPQLTSWLDGDRIASACPEPLGCPPLVSVFWSGLLAGDVIEPQVQPVPEPTTAMGLVAGVAALALTLIPKLRDRSAPLR